MNLKSRQHSMKVIDPFIRNNILSQVQNDLLLFGEIGNWTAYGLKRLGFPMKEMTIVLFGKKTFLL